MCTPHPHTRTNHTTRQEHTTQFYPKSCHGCNTFLHLYRTIGTVKIKTKALKTYPHQAKYV